ncbi:glutathione transferase GstA [Taklimakanibacter deserti]|uniref:glutathione transferase GstA n=1 Tax=Taklimakanibacter deserti TaxID=2267839 RepID=UPI000E657C47
MKLYYSPGACSLSPHIVLRELGLPFALERVDMATKKTATGADYLRVNAKGYVPALELDDGEILTEGAAIIQYLADQKPETRLTPPTGSLPRARLHEHLNFLSSELHKAFGPLFTAAAPEDAKRNASKNVGRLFDHFEKLLSDGRRYLLGETYTIADPYLFVIAGWAKPTGIGFAKWPNLGAFVERIGMREAVQAALKAEGGA